MNHLLLLEDEAVIRASLTRLLEREGYRVQAAETLEQARGLLNRSGFDLILADLRLPDGQGTELLTADLDTPLIIITSYASVRSAVEAMKRGAVDYIAKPFDHDELLLLIERTLRTGALSRRNAQLESELAQRYPVHGLVGHCPAMQSVFAQIAKVAPTDANVLILGESGTGKELVARAIHAQSRRAEGPIITVNCASIPESLIESELFGFEKGAFTGAVKRHAGLISAANNGTLFLDEIGELSASIQAQLLRVLQDGEIRRLGSTRNLFVNIRLIAATHRDLARMVREGSFREDLYYRLNVVNLHLPPLRERVSDIVPLARFLLDKLATQLNRPAMSLTEEALTALQGHRWPGNVRELQNTLERAVILAEESSIDAEVLGLPEPGTHPPGPLAAEEPLSLEDYFRRFVLHYQDEMTETELARRLGISRKALWERRQKMGLHRTRRATR